MLQSGTINVNFRFGVTIEVINIPHHHLVRENELYYISGYDDVAYENVYMKNNSFWTMDVNYFKEWRLELWGMYENKFQKLYRHDFNLDNKDVLFHLKPNNHYDFDVWVEYLKYFQKIKNCNITLTQNKYSSNQSIFPITNSVTNNFYAGYLVSWDDNRMVNPYGVHFNAFDLINKRLLNI